MKTHNFSAGPSILPEEVFKQTSQAVLNFQNTGLSILEISHRSKEFIVVMEEARSLLLKLLNLNNKGYKALFLQGGASMQFFMVPYNLLPVNGKAAYLETGTWASNAIKTAKGFGEIVIVGSSKHCNFNTIPENYDIPSDASYFHCTSNNTIYGTQMTSFPKTSIPLVCDMSSDILSRDIDYSQFDVIYAGAQKNMGPAGATAVIVKESVLEKTGRDIPGIMDWQQHILKESMYNTPSVFAIYTSLLTLQWLDRLGGVPAIETINKAKAEMIYAEIDRNPLFKGTANPKFRSCMNATFIITQQKLTPLFDELCKEAGISGIKGHRSVGGYRASMYNALPLESVKILTEVMKHLETKA